MAQKCLSFDGIDDRVNLPNNGTLRPRLSDWCFEFWLKWTAYTGNNYVFEMMDGANRYCNIRLNNGGQLQLQFCDGTTYSNPTLIGGGLMDSAWHYIVVNLDRDGDATAYQDTTEKLHASIAAVGDVNPDDAPIIWGHKCAYLLDEFRISNKIRSAAERAAAYNNGNGVQFEVDANTVALWHMNEGSAGTIYDETNNDNDGTIYGASWTDGYDFLTSHPTSSDAGSGLDASTLSEVFFSADSGVGLGALATLLAVINTSEVSSGSDRLRAKIESATTGGDMKLPPGGQASIPSRKVGI